jgi:hypothetical protein
MRRLRPWWLLFVVVLLAGCENSATSYTIDTSQHAVVLVREQPYFWDAQVKQYIVASRLPNCQRKIAIHPDAKALTPIEVFEAGSLLWALRQGSRWYLVSTELCAVQDWVNANGMPPGRSVGEFRAGPDKPVFVPAGG